MKITNKTGLPGPIVKAVENDQWDRGAADISVTELISPIRQVALNTHYREQIEEDAADRIFALMGKVGHGILEKAGYDAFQEERLYQRFGTWTLSGQVDSLYLENLKDDTWGIDDYKFTSLYVAKNASEANSRVQSWRLQLNLYRMLAEHNGFPISRLRLVMLLRDWSVLGAKRDPESPQKQVVVFEVPLMPLEPLQLWTRNKIEQHMEAQQGFDQKGQGELPFCTDEETWRRPSVFAVMKDGRKSALKLESSEVEAAMWACQNGYGKLQATSHNDEIACTLKNGISIVERPGEFVRCENYCAVAKFCDQHKEQKHDETG